MPANIAYQTSEIADFYGCHRRRWEEFYPSERWVLERAGQNRKSLGQVLDVGCAAGGLGEALAEHFTLDRYVGVDISSGAIAFAQSRTAAFSVPCEFHSGDICDASLLRMRQFDLVVALSVVDWNCDPQGILSACWGKVKPGGNLLLSLRLTTEATMCDVNRSYQHIWFRDGPAPADTEVAQYSVFNVSDAMASLSKQSPIPSDILAYGYWGSPSSAARTPFQKLLFSVLLLSKPPLGAEGQAEPRIEAHWPASAFTFFGQPDLKG